MATPTQRSRDWLKKRGTVSQIVERWNSFARIRQDLFGFCDIVSLEAKITAIQVTSGTNVAARVNKIFDEPRARAWLASGGMIEVHGWRKTGKAGKRKLWSLRRVAVELDGMGAMVSREIEL